MSRKNTTVKIKASTVELAQMLFGWLRTNSGELTRGLNNHMRSLGAGNTDVTFENVNPDKFTMEITENPTDKGDVVVLDPDKNLTFTEYTSLDDGELYGVMDGGRGAIFQYIEGEVDRDWETYLD